MENYEDYINILTEKEKVMLEDLLNKLAVSGCEQYNTPVAKLTFTNNTPIHEDNIQQIKDDLRYLDEYVMETQDMLRSRPLVTILEQVRNYIDVINSKISKI